MIKPPPLGPGDTIGVMAPSSRTDSEALEKNAAVLQTAGYQIYLHPQTKAQYGPFAGTGKEKAEALHSLFEDPSIKAVIAATGGNGANQMLPYLDYERLSAYPKILLGFSDVTALLNGLYAKTRLLTFHGPVLQYWAKLNDKDRAQCLSLLAGKPSAPLTAGHILRQGTASGPLIGGNLSVFCSLLGTPYQPATKGAILFLEDCGDERSRFDRYLAHLSNAGIFKDIAGLILGDFTDVTDTGRIPFTHNLTERLQDYLGAAEIPVITDAPFGHGSRLKSFPVGGTASLSAENEIRLQIAPAVQA